MTVAQSLVLRTTAAAGARAAARAAMGVAAGCLLWGAAVAVGLGALLAASETAFATLKWAGAGYLSWLGLHMLLRPRERFATEFALDSDAGGARTLGWFWKGLLQNWLNPKVGVFYVSFLPQFVPATAPGAAYTLLLAALHGALGLIWFTALILATRPLAGLLRRPAVIKAIDRFTGCVFLAFGAKLALSRR
jgi:threonine/homoserine/homoserine lactone efflux protein